MSDVQTVTGDNLLDTGDDVTTSVVLPTYNEAGNLERVLEELNAAFGQAGMGPYRPYEVVVIDGGSSDGTREIIEWWAATTDHVRGIYMRRRFGQSPALAAGFDAATGDYVVPMDADGQNDPSDIPRLLQRLDADGLDCVSGWRRDREDPWHKTIPSGIQTHLAKATGPDINDFGCTLKAYRAEALDEIDLYGEGHRYIPAKLHKLGYDIGEQEVNHRPREHGQSRYGVGRLIRGFVDLLFHVVWNRYSTRPMHILGGGGVALLGLGVGLGLYSVIEKYAFGAALAPHLPRLVLTVGLVVFGLQLLVFGVVAEMLTKLYYRDDEEYRIDRVIEE